jgi:hypothetical protein
MDVNDIPDGVKAGTILMFNSIRSIGSLHAFEQYFVLHNLIFLSIGSARLMSTRSPSLMKVVMCCTLEVMIISVRSVLLLISLVCHLVLFLLSFFSTVTINCVLVYLPKNRANIEFVYNRRNWFNRSNKLYASNSFENGRMECSSF